MADVKALPITINRRARYQSWRLAPFLTPYSFRIFSKWRWHYK